MNKRQRIPFYVCHPAKNGGSVRKNDDEEEEYLHACVDIQLRGRHLVSVSQRGHIDFFLSDKLKEVLNIMKHDWN